MHFFVRNFNIRVVEKADNDCFFSSDGNPILDIMSKVSLLDANAPSILADPFLFVHKEELFLFYEHQDKWIGGKGRICMRKTRNMKEWTDEVTVLEEPFHLSFPNVFDDNGVIYMLPETGGDRSISLYKAVDDSLTKWTLVKKIMEGGEPWYDSTILWKDGKYFLFSSHDDDIEQELHLFVADSFFGPYTEHPSSPVCRGRDCGRNAGSIIQYNGCLYRPVQVCVNSYGEQTSVMKIEEITPSVYRETPYSTNIINTNVYPFKDGGHQFNPIYFKGRWIVALDNRVKNYNIIELYRKCIGTIRHHR